MKTSNNNVVEQPETAHIVLGLSVVPFLGLLDYVILSARNITRVDNVLILINDTLTISVNK